VRSRGKFESGFRDSDPYDTSLTTPGCPAPSESWQAGLNWTEEGTKFCLHNQTHCCSTARTNTTHRLLFKTRGGVADTKPSSWWGGRVPGIPKIGVKKYDEQQLRILINAALTAPRREVTLQDGAGVDGDRPLCWRRGALEGKKTRTRDENSIFWFRRVVFGNQTQPPPPPQKNNPRAWLCTNSVAAKLTQFFQTFLRMRPNLSA